MVGAPRLELGTFWSRIQWNPRNAPTHTNYLQQNPRFRPSVLVRNVAFRTQFTERKTESHLRGRPPLSRTDRGLSRRKSVAVQLKSRGVPNRMNRQRQTISHAGYGGLRRSPTGTPPSSMFRKAHASEKEATAADAQVHPIPDAVIHLRNPRGRCEKVNLRHSEGLPRSHTWDNSHVRAL